MYAVILALIPLFFLPITQDFYDTNKWMLFLVLSLASFFVWTISIVRKGAHTSVNLSPVTVGLGLITIAAFASTIIISPNKIESLTHPFGPLTFSALFLFSLLAPSFFDDKTKRLLLWGLFIATGILGLIAVYQFFGMGKVMFPKVAFMNDPLWTPTGATTATVSLFIIMLPIIISGAFEAHKKQREALLAILIIVAITVLAGLVITVGQLVTRIAGTLLPPVAGWAILLEILKNPKNALFGVGAENFLAAFSAGRPLTLNNSPLWNIRFTTNANMLFHLTTVYGLFGAASAFVFLKSFVGKISRNALSISLIIALVALLVVPPNLTVLFVATLLAVLSSLGHSRTYSVNLSHLPRIVRIAIPGIAAVFCIAGLYGLVRTYDAERTFYRSLEAAKANNGTQTYNLQIAAISKNPNLSRFHIIYSQTNLALAASVARGISERGSDASAEDIQKDRDLVAQLIQQSIREAKIAVSQNQFNVLAWENLARIYSQLIDVAQGADSWTIATYRQAIALDPTNPVLHLELGSVLLRSKQYSEAITEFQRSASAKPDFANAYYNLANAYKTTGDIPQAIRAMEQAKSLVDAKSDDYSIVTRELEDLNKAQETKSKPAISPTPTPTPIIVPPLDLPAGSGPNQ